MDGHDTIRVGSVALAGAPNVGKSSLLNRVVGKHLCAVSSRPQTTRNRITAVANVVSGHGATQIIFVDTPGVQSGSSPLRRFMRQQAESAVADCDLTLALIDARHVPESPPEFLKMVRSQRLVVLNKVDLLRSRDLLLPALERVMSWGYGPAVPISVKTGDGVKPLLDVIADKLPEGPQLFPLDMATDRDEAFIASELIREQAFHQLGGEIPYETAVVIEAWEDFDNGDVRIAAAISVERDSQKAIVIGKGGARIKALGEKARHEISALLGCKVHLKLHVRVDAKWSRSEKRMRELGYRE